MRHVDVQRGADGKYLVSYADPEHAGHYGYEAHEAVRMAQALSSGRMGLLARVAPRSAVRLAHWRLRRVAGP